MGDILEERILGKDLPELGESELVVGPIDIEVPSVGSFYS